MSIGLYLIEFIHGVQKYKITRFKNHTLFRNVYLLLLLISNSFYSAFPLALRKGLHDFSSTPMDHNQTRNL